MDFRIRKPANNPPQFLVFGDQSTSVTLPSIQTSTERGWLLLCLQHILLTMPAWASVPTANMPCCNTFIHSVIGDGVANVFYTRCTFGRLGHSLSIRLIHKEAFDILVLHQESMMLHGGPCAGATGAVFYPSVSQWALREFHLTRDAKGDPIKSALFSPFMWQVT